MQFIYWFYESSTSSRMFIKAVIENVLCSIRIHCVWHVILVNVTSKQLSYRMFNHT